MTIDVQIVLTPKMLRAFPQIAETVIQQAIERAKVRIKLEGQMNTPVGDPANFGYTSTGRVPGQLLSSFDVASTPRSIVMKWDAKWKGFAYDKVVEHGRTGYNPFPARNYAAATTQRAREILLEELQNGFMSVGGS